VVRRVQYIAGETWFEVVNRLVELQHWESASWRVKGRDRDQHPGDPEVLRL